MRPPPADLEKHVLHVREPDALEEQHVDPQRDDRGQKRARATIENAWFIKQHRAKMRVDQNPAFVIADLAVGA